MRTVVFRAEASAAYGLGHLMRCTALADALPLDTPPVFVLRDSAARERVTAPLTTRGWDVRVLAADATTAADAAMTQAVAAETGADVIVTDLCHRDVLSDPPSLQAYHRALGTGGVPVVSIEDCRMPGFASDLAIVPYDCHAPAFAGAPFEGRLLHGLDYYIAGRAFADAAGRVRVIREQADRVLVCIGGADPNGLALKIAEALAGLGEQGPSVRIVIGKGMATELADKVRAVAAGRPNIDAMDFTNDLAGELLRADVAIIGEGLVRYEAAMTGTPSLTISQFEHASDVLNAFYARGTTHYLGDGNLLGHDAIAAAVTALLCDTDRRRAQSAAGKTLLDGRGAERVAAAIVDLARSKNGKSAN